MKLKKLMPMLLFLTVLINPIFNQESTTKKKTLEKELGIDLSKNYSGDEVFELLSIVIEEADSSIESAYQEGYKQATLELQPIIVELQLQLDANKTKSFDFNITLFSISFGVGLITGLIPFTINSILN